MWHSVRGISHSAVFVPVAPVYGRRRRRRRAVKEGIKTH